MPDYPAAIAALRNAAAVAGAPAARGLVTLGTLVERERVRKAKYIAEHSDMTVVEVLEVDGLFDDLVRVLAETERALSRIEAKLYLPLQQHARMVHRMAQHAADSMVLPPKVPCSRPDGQCPRCQGSHDLKLQDFALIVSRIMEWPCTSGSLFHSIQFLFSWFWMQSYMWSVLLGRQTSMRSLWSMGDRRLQWNVPAAFR